jgi:hypothetical protein
VNLDFANLDDLLAAVHFDHLDPSGHLRDATTLRIGPVVELLLHARARTLDARALPESPVVTSIRNLMGRIQPGTGSFNQGDSVHVGFILTARDPEHGDLAPWYQFLKQAEQAAAHSGLPAQTASQLVAAIREMEDNIHVHSERSHDGIVGFRATDLEFEFVIADSGIGALHSLRQHADYSDLEDAGRALQLVLSEGESRFGRNAGHGGGFHGLFRGLADLNGQLRFRTGDHALTIDGSTPALERSQISQKVPLVGFLASVTCYREPVEA